MSFKEIQQEKTAQIERILKAYLPRVQGYQEVIMDAMSYSMLAGGKRLRPMLMQETYRMFGGTDRVIEPFMAAIEMIHTYSLVHDDLPAMDNDEYRRGRKTTHVVYRLDVLSDQKEKMEYIQTGYLYDYRGNPSFCDRYTWIK